MSCRAWSQEINPKTLPLLVNNQVNQLSLLPWAHQCRKAKALSMVLAQADLIKFYWRHLLQEVKVNSSKKQLL